MIDVKSLKVIARSFWFVLFFRAIVCVYVVYHSLFNHLICLKLIVHISFSICLKYCKSPVYTVNCGMAYGQAAMLLSLGARGYRALQPNSSSKN